MGRIAFTASTGGPVGTFVVNEDGTGFARLSPPYRRTRRTEYTPAWSPDGRRIAVRAYVGAALGGARYELYVMRADGSGARSLRVRRAGGLGNFDWSPDGRRIVFDAFDEGSDRHRLHLIDLPSGKITRLTGGDDFSPLWSPDGSQIAFLRFRGETSELRVLEADGSGSRRLAARARRPAWSPDGSLIADSRGIRPARLHLINPASAKRSTLASVRGELGQLAWSPDGRQIAFEVFDRRRGWDIQLIDLDTGVPRRLTDDRGDELGPTWSPDGSRIVHAHSPVPPGRDNFGTFDVYSMRADGTSTRRLTRCRCVAGGSLSWQPR